VHSCRSDYGPAHTAEGTSRVARKASGSSRLTVRWRSRSGKPAVNARTGSERSIATMPSLAPLTSQRPRQPWAPTLRRTGGAGRVRRRRPGVGGAERTAALFRLLGDRSRTRILFALAEAGELCVCDLAAAVGVPETSVSQALRLLRTAGAVRARRSGRMVW